jgi:hypothetical protein
VVRSTGSDPVNAAPDVGQQTAPAAPGGQAGAGLQPNAGPGGLPTVTTLSSGGTG